MMRTLFVVVTLSLLAMNSSATCTRFDADNLLKIGTEHRVLEKALKREIKLAAMGVETIGFSTESKVDFLDYGFKAKRWRNLEGLDVMFDVPSGGTSKIVFVAYGLPCAEVEALKKVCGGISKKGSPKQWSRSYVKQKIVIRGSLTPVCSVNIDAR